MAKIKNLIKTEADLIMNEIILTNPQILNINTSPIDIVPAAGINKVIIPIRIMFKRKGYTTLFAASTTFRTTYTNSANFIASHAVFFNSSLDNYWAVFQNFTSILGSTIYLPNLPLKLGASANPSLGDGEMVVRVRYKIIDLS